MKTEAVAAVLARTRLLAGLDPVDLGSVAERVVPRRFTRGQLVFVEGDVGDSLYVVAEGQVKIFVTSPEGAELVLATLEPPELFGEVAFLDGGARSASVAAVEETVLLALARSSLLELWRDHPVLGDRFLRHLGGLVRRLTTQASDLLFLDLDGRVAKLLVSLATDRGTLTPEGVVLDLRLTQSDLAAMVGGSRQSVNRSLRAFERGGFLVLEPPRIVIADIDGLRERAKR